jgi:hypothetical protein
MWYFSGGLMLGKYEPPTGRGKAGKKVRKYS